MFCWQPVLIPSSRMGLRTAGKRRHQALEKESVLAPTQQPAACTSTHCNLGAHPPAHTAAHTLSACSKCVAARALHDRMECKGTREACPRTCASAGRAVQRPASASAASSSQRPTSQPFQLTIKATLGNESKLVTAPLTVSYYELLQAVKAKYPDAGACQGGTLGCGGHSSGRQRYAVGGCSREVMRSLQTGRKMRPPWSGYHPHSWSLVYC